MVNSMIKLMYKSCEDERLINSYVKHITRRGHILSMIDDDDDGNTTLGFVEFAPSTFSTSGDNTEYIPFDVEKRLEDALFEEQLIRDGIEE